MLLLLAAVLCSQAPDAGQARGKPMLQQLGPAPALTAAPAKPPRELITVDGTPGLTAFIDKDQVGLRDGKRLLAWKLPAPLDGDVGSAFTVPGRPDQYIACLDRDCARGRPCAPDRDSVPKRECVWMAPKCGAAVLFAQRFVRVEKAGSALTAEILAHPSCLNDGAEPRWLDDGSAPKLGTVLQGDLETHPCAPPTWTHAATVVRWTANGPTFDSAYALPQCPAKP